VEGTDAGVRRAAGAAGATRVDGPMRVDGVKGRRVLVAAAGAGVAAVLLAACGVPTTGVVDVGEPAVGLPTVPGARPETVVFFLDGGRLTAAGREVTGGTGGPETVTAALDLLFAGPAALGRPELTTRLAQPRAVIGVRTEGHTVTVRLPAGVPLPDDLGMRQVACTAVVAFRSDSPVLRPTSGSSALSASGGAAATVPPGAVAVPVRIVVIGSDGHAERTDPSCPPLFPATSPPPTTS
jgi:hypothetical protein